MTEQNQQNTAVVPTKKAPLRSGGQVLAIVPQDIDQVFRMANAIAQSKMAPKTYLVDPKNDSSGFSTEKITVGILHGAEVGLTPMAALQSIAVINGMPSIWGDGALGLILGSGLVEDMDESIVGEGDAVVATCTIKRRDRPKPIVRTFSMADAKKANLTGKAGPWQQYPKRMCQMRARAWSIRDGFADVLRGVKIREEVEDHVLDATEQPDGTYSAGPAPARPTRESYQGGTTIEATAQPTEETPAEDEAPKPVVLTLVDTQGEVVGEFTNPVAYTGELTRLIRIPSTDLMTLWSNNAEAIEILQANHEEGCYRPLEQVYLDAQAKQDADKKAAEEAEAAAKAEREKPKPAPESENPAPQDDGRAELPPDDGQGTAEVPRDPPQTISPYLIEVPGKPGNEAWGSWFNRMTVALKKYTALAEFEKFLKVNEKNLKKFDEINGAWAAKLRGQLTLHATKLGKK